MNSACILSYSQTKIGLHPEKSTLDLAAQVFIDALQKTNISKNEIDGLFLVQEGFGQPISLILGARLIDYFQLKNIKSCCKFEMGGQSALNTLHYAAQSIVSGQNKLCVVLAAEKGIDANTEKDFHGFLHSTGLLVNGTYGPYLAPYGLTTAVMLYAFCQQRYMYEYNVSEEDIAYLPVILRDNASKNADAYFQKPITVEDVLNSRVISSPIKLLECTKFLEGAACIILADESYAKKIRERKIFVSGYGEYHDNSHFIPFSADKKLSEFKVNKPALTQALAQADKKINDIDVAEVYGVFAGIEHMVYEDLGFFKKGESAKAVKDGLTKIDGQIPINTSGGRISLGHPPAVTPLLETIEICKQLRNEAELRQVKNVNVGLCTAEHGMLNGAACMILEGE